MGGLKNVVNGKARYYFKRVEEIKKRKQLSYILMYIEKWSLQLWQFLQLLFLYFAYEL